MGSPIPLWDCWQSLGEKRQVLGITFSWSPSSVKSKALTNLGTHFTNDHYFPPSFFLLLFCFFSPSPCYCDDLWFWVPASTGHRSVNRLFHYFLLKLSCSAPGTSICEAPLHSWYILITLAFPLSPQYTQMCIYLLTWDMFVFIRIQCKLRVINGVWAFTAQKWTTVHLKLLQHC